MSLIWTALFCSHSLAASLNRPYWKSYTPPRLYWKKNGPKRRKPDPAGPRLDRLYWKR